jgi:hypothetical protein
MVLPRTAARTPRKKIRELGTTARELGGRKISERRWRLKNQ